VAVRQVAEEPAGFGWKPAGNEGLGSVGVHQPQHARLWEKASIPGEYDVVADFGNNTSDPLAFVPDNTLTSPTDLVGRLFRGWIPVVADPTRYAVHTGRHL